MTKPIVRITHEYVPESYELPSIWITITAKPSQKIFGDSLRDVIKAAIESVDWEVEVIE